MELSKQPHRRYNPLKGEWVLVSAQRTERPWLGKTEKSEEKEAKPYDPNCYLCPGNCRASGRKNPNYKYTLVFPNDFPALLGEGEDLCFNQADLLKAESERGECLVICYSPRHDLTLPLLEVAAIERIIRAWQKETIRLAQRFNSVLIFENRGALMGCSNPHPHGQIWANSSLPNIISLEDEKQLSFLYKKKKCLLCEYGNLEENLKERLVLANKSFLVVVPFWAVWPYETLVIPRQHAGDLSKLNPAEVRDLASILKALQTRYDNLFATSFPFSMGIHQNPFRTKTNKGWHWHIHFNPPLLRSASIQKFMVGYELFAMPQRDLTAEEAARRLLALPDIHYSKVTKPFF